uniref:Uncharacterized protein n=1 Tax=Ananas comosus var. bracteatus TaxID=296719 RepID=A0A6V7PUY8_ANACO|nr:unnamed protein product [Ananas comosus var. bracteatus]
MAVPGGATSPRPSLRPLKLDDFIQAKAKLLHGGNHFLLHEGDLLLQSAGGLIHRGVDQIETMLNARTLRQWITASLGASSSCKTYGGCQHKSNGTSGFAIAIQHNNRLH